MGTKIVHNPLLVGKLGLSITLSPRQNNHTGLVEIHGCDDPRSPLKTVQLEKNGNRVVLNGISQQNAISIVDEDFHKRLQENTCDTLNKNYSLPYPFPLYSIRIIYNVTMFRCKHDLKIKHLPRYFKYSCHDYDVYYDSSPSPNNEEAHSLFSSCSVIQLSKKDLTDTKDILSFVSAEMVVEVVLSNDCNDCYNRNGGQCRLDSNQKFYCYKDSFNQSPRPRESLDGLEPS